LAELQAFQNLSFAKPFNFLSFHEPYKCAVFSYQGYQGYQGISCQSSGHVNESGSYAKISNDAIISNGENDAQGFPYMNGKKVTQFF
jgi:hypothetical protein